MLKRHNQAKIIKKSVFLFQFLNMAIWCEYVYRIELRKYFTFCVAHLPVVRNKDEIWLRTCMSKIIATATPNLEAKIKTLIFMILAWLCRFKHLLCNRLFNLRGLLFGLKQEPYINCNNVVSESGPFDPPPPSGSCRSGTAHVVAWDVRGGGGCHAADLRGCLTWPVADEGGCDVSNDMVS